jgi:hypothetical protein
MQRTRALPVLGILQIQEVFEEMEEPLLYLAQAETGILYLGILAVDTYEQQCWIYVEVSEHRIRQLKAKVLDLFTAFHVSETGSVYWIEMERKAGGRITTGERASHGLSIDVLPYEGEYLEPVKRV